MGPEVELTGADPGRLEGESQPLFAQLAFGDVHDSAKDPRRSACFVVKGRRSRGHPVDAPVGPDDSVIEGDRRLAGYRVLDFPADAFAVFGWNPRDILVEGDVAGVWRQSEDPSHGVGEVDTMSPRSMSPVPIFAASKVSPAAALRSPWRPPPPACDLQISRRTRTRRCRRQDAGRDCC